MLRRRPSRLQARGRRVEGDALAGDDPGEVHNTWVDFDANTANLNSARELKETQERLSRLTRVHDRIEIFTDEKKVRP
jgi:hypothetical protein